MTEDIDSPDAPYVLTLGETMALFRTTTPGPLAHAATASIGIGGSESNVAIGLRRLGIPSVWCGRVGVDSLGELVTREIRAEGVDARVRVDSDAPTGLMIKEQRTAQHQRVQYYRAGSAGSRLAPEDVTTALIRGAALVHLTGITLALSAQASKTWKHVALEAKNAGVAVSMDLNYRRALWTPEEAATAYREVLPLVEMLFAGEDEAAIVVGAEGGVSGMARRLSAFGPSEVVIKRGANGAYALAGDIEHSEPVVAVDAIDTVGAGDAFVAGYLSGRVLGRPLSERMRTGVLTGAFACLSPGDWEGLPRRADLSMLESTEPVTR